MGSEGSERKTGSALVYARHSAHDRNSRMSFILGERSRAEDVALGCSRGGFDRMLLDRRESRAFREGLCGADANLLAGPAFCTK
jgi:hypothetical protein